MSGCTDCSHDHDAHEHFRAGSDCSLCECVAYRRSPVALVRRFLHRGARAAVAAPPAAPTRATAA